MAPAGGNNNPNPAGEIDARLANLYLTISGDFVYSPNPTWPTGNVPPCVTLTLTAPNSQVAVGGSATLTFGPPTPQFASTPLAYVPTQCTLSASDGTYATPAMVGTSGSLSTGTLTKPGTYTATLECAGAATDTASSFATTSVAVASGPTLSSITVAPNPATVVAGTTQQFTATGNYSSGPSQTLHSVSWGTSNGVATINGSGLATCLGVGSSTITAASGNIIGTAALNCSAAVLTSITVTPASPTLTAGQTQQFTASGTNSLNQSTTPAVTWSSGSPTVAAITSGGLATCALQGSTTITATSGAVSGSATLTCNPGPLASLTLPTPESIPVGANYPYYPIGMDAGGNVVGPGTVTYASTNPAVAPVTSSGDATCLTQGSSSITAMSGNVTSNPSLLNCGGIALSANPTTTMINTNVTLSWTSAGLPMGESCTLTSNSSDAPLNLTGQPTSGTITTTEAVSQNVTYTISCTGSETVSSSVSVLYTLITTYQYTGNQFPSGDAYGQYSSADRVIASLTVSVPFGPNATVNNGAALPGEMLTLSDGVQTLSLQSASSSYVQVTTDASGNIGGAWSIGLNGSASGISTQDYPPPDGMVDFGYLRARGRAPT
jgi:hypothetical protein